ncbi:MAG: hypothetical protein H0W50_04075 [Parachlamydiaceae bacterium]|nr:hypothetical protein [Parachlamydiaceae bacterium]
MPILPITQVNYQANKQSKKEKVKLEEKTGNRSMIKMHGKILTASTATLTKLISEKAKQDQAQKKNKGKGREEDKDLESIADGILTLPEYLLNMQMNADNDFFAKLHQAI